MRTSLDEDSLATSSSHSSVPDIEAVAGLVRENDEISTLDGDVQNVPTAAPSIADEALSRKLTQIQSRRSEGVNSNISAARRLSGTAVPLESVPKVNKYERFTNSKKYLMVALASSSCFLSPMSGLAFLPAVPEISADFHTTGEIINISAAVYCVFMSMSPCVFSPCSDIYGRRPTFIVCLVFFSLCTVLVAVSQNLAMFYVFRALSALFGTAFFTTAAHMMGDIYKPTERGTAMGLILCGTQAGPAFGPVIGGIIVTYTSWRVIFWVLAACGAVMAIVVIIFMPETAVETKMQILLKEIHIDNPKKKFVWISYNPFRVIDALKYPNLFLGGFIVMSLTFTMYGLLTPIRYVVDPRFKLTSPIYGALFYLPPGVGYLVGSVFGGRWADYVVKRNIKQKNGKRIPEDRIKAILIPLGIVYPCSILIYGWTLEKEKGGMAVPIIFSFISGVAQTFVFPASNTYCVDSMPELGGDAVGSSYFSRYIASAIASATCLRSIESIGIGLTCTISACVLWIALGCAVVLILYGERLRVNALNKYGLRSSKNFDNPKNDK
ncbi:hypothetical protein CLIB1423_33S00144 [[Candida] railenensis]|uniref:Major facilitator superfamily (MFS) profile domain-containing protein n=1 Tax=[Candida] railenensis TaxID=45579 RepID=A0A9P0W1J9_9ASCO|nr:hypothetical protein CLIB1423_33S00144 [[Candida] railenensis]